MSVLLKRAACWLALSIVLPVAPAVAQAQTVRDARVQVTVVDPSGAVVPESAVTLVGLDDPTRTTAVPVVKSNERGVAVLERVLPGRYSITAEFPGFELGLLRDIRIRAGDSRHVVVLPLPKLSGEVVVTRNRQEAAADRRESEFGMALSRDQIDALSDDPAEMQRQLSEIAGPDAVFRVDSFEGQQLPPRAQIKSIRIVRDQFAAEAANPGATTVEIITQPGLTPLTGGFNVNFQDGSMSGKSRFTPTRGPEQTRNFGGNIAGTIVEGRTGFNVALNGNSTYTTPIVNVVLPTGARSETLGLRQPGTSLNANVLIDHAVTKNQTLRAGLNVNYNNRENQGVGAYDLPERGFSREQTTKTFQIQEAGPIGRRTFINSRATHTWAHFDILPAAEAPTVVVTDTFTSGGAQQRQSVHARQLRAASDIDHIRGIHSWRAGVQMEGTWFRASSAFNYLGTYTFASLADYNAGKPILYTRSLGAPEVQYHNIQGAVYLQDDIRVRRGLTFSPGVRYSLQEDIKDWSGIAPRFGVTWSPTKAGTTTLRASAGLFHGYFPLEMLERTLRLNGELQREIYISDPSYPNPPTSEAQQSPTNKYVIGNFDLQRNLRYSLGIDRVLTPRIRFNALYAYLHYQQQPRGENTDPIINGVRPDPRYANVIEAVTDAQIRRHDVNVNWIFNFATPSPTLNQARFNWRRMNLNAGYRFTRARNNSNGPWDLPPTGDVNDDWGPGAQDAPYGFQMLMTSNQIRNVTVNLNYFANAGAPYTLTTGLDDNRDGFVNDRPAGVGLRSLRGDGTSTLSGRVQYTFQMGSVTAGPGAGGPPRGRYRFNLFANFANLTNRQNLVGYSGVAKSPFFRQPTSVMNPRRVEMGLGVNF